MTGIRESRRKGEDTCDTHVTQPLCIPFVIRGVTSLLYSHPMFMTHPAGLPSAHAVNHHVLSIPLLQVSLFSAPSAHTLGLQVRGSMSRHSTLCPGGHAHSFGLHFTLYTFSVSTVAGPQIMLLCSISRKKNQLWPGPLCGVARSPCLCGFPLALRSPPTSQRCAHEMGLCVHIVLV